MLPRKSPPIYTDPEEIKFYGGDYTEFYKGWIDPIQDLGWQLGYNIVVHGSTRRDLDMIAVPWIEDCVSDKVLAEQICSLIDGRIGGFAEGQRRGKPHGRVCWSIHFHGKDHRNIHKYIDLSVIVDSCKNNVTS